MLNFLKNSQSNQMIWHALLTVTLFAGLMILPDAALAAAVDDSPMAGVLCKMVKWMTGTTGRAIATLAIIIIGIGALMGKVSWGMAIIVVIGIALVFGAPSIVTQMSSSLGNDANSGELCS